MKRARVRLAEVGAWVILLAYNGLAVVFFAFFLGLIDPATVSERGWAPLLGYAAAAIMSFWSAFLVITMRQRRRARRNGIIDGNLHDLAYAYRISIPIYNLRYWQRQRTEQPRPTGPTGSIHWEDEYYQSGLANIGAKDFVNKAFEARPSLVRRHPRDGWYEEREYKGGDYDADEFKLLPGGWDHEHCGVCGWRIEPGDSYWENSEQFILCDRCHAYVAHGRA